MKSFVISTVIVAVMLVGSYYLGNLLMDSFDETIRQRIISSIIGFGAVMAIFTIFRTYTFTKRIVQELAEKKY